MRKQFKGAAVRRITFMAVCMAALSAQAASTGECQGTAQTTFFNQTVHELTDFSIVDRRDVDFGRTLPSAVAPLGGKPQGNGLFLPDQIGWTTTLSAGKNSSVTVRFKVKNVLLNKRTQARGDVLVDLKYAGEYHNKWTPNTGKMVQGLSKVVLGAAMKKTSSVVGGVLSATSAMVSFSATSGMYMQASAKVDSASAPNFFKVEIDKPELTTVSLTPNSTDLTGELALVIAPVPDNCPHAGWFVTLMPYDQYKTIPDLY